MQVCRICFLRLSLPPPVVLPPLSSPAEPCAEQEIQLWVANSVAPCKCNHEPCIKKRPEGIFKVAVELPRRKRACPARSLDVQTIHVAAMLVLEDVWKVNSGKLEWVPWDIQAMVDICGSHHKYTQIRSPRRSNYAHQTLKKTVAQICIHTSYICIYIYMCVYIYIHVKMPAYLAIYLSIYLSIYNTSHAQSIYVQPGSVNEDPV